MGYALDPHQESMGIRFTGHIRHLSSLPDTWATSDRHHVRRSKLHHSSPALWSLMVSQHTKSRMCHPTKCPLSFLESVFGGTHVGTDKTSIALVTSLFVTAIAEKTSWKPFPHLGSKTLVFWKVVDASIAKLKPVSTPNPKQPRGSCVQNIQFQSGRNGK